MNNSLAETHDIPLGPITKAQTEGIDWLTTTAKSGKARREIYEAVIQAFGALKAEGNNTKPWKFQGYAGLRCQGHRWGTRTDSDIWMLSGAEANDYWHLALSLAENVSRVDLAVTVGLAAPIPDFAWKIYENVANPLSGITRCKKVSFVTNNDGGQTLYIGSRSSDQFGRLYDKGRQNIKTLDLDAGILWRYEVEFKGNRARKIAKQLKTLAAFPQSAGNVIAATVQEWFLCRAVPSLLVTKGVQAFCTQVEARISDDQITLNWLSSQVAPSVARLAKKGKVREVMEALAFSPLDRDAYS